MISTDNSPGALVENPFIKADYEKVFPGAPFKMFNPSTHYYKQYDPEKLLARPILFLAVIAMIISVMWTS